MSSGIPHQLKRLIRTIVRAFYSTEAVLVMDVLLRTSAANEDQLVERLKLDKRQLRVALTTLKAEKLTRVKLKVVTQDNKAVRHTYYYVNYQSFVNTAKYKLDQVSKRIQQEEREETSRSSFICSSCAKTFTDLEAGQLLDMSTSNLICSFCGEQVIEDPNQLPKANARLVFAKFNTQFAPIYALIREVEDFKLPASLLEPDIADMENIPQGMSNNSLFNSTDGSMFNSGLNSGGKENERFRSNVSQYEMSLMSEQSSEVLIEDSTLETTFKSLLIENGSSDGNSSKGQPKWMSESTVKSSLYTRNKSLSQHGQSNSTPFSRNSGTTHLSSNNKHENIVDQSKEILDLLLYCEHKDESSDGRNDSFSLQSPQYSSTNGYPMANHHLQNGHHSAELDEETLGNLPILRIGSDEISIEEVDENWISQMTSSERETYTRLVQHFYSNLYDC